MKKLVCLFLCGSLVFGLFAQSQADFVVTNEMPLFNTGFDISSPFFNHLGGGNNPTQTSMFGQPLMQFSLDTEARTWNHADFGITRYASSSNDKSTFWPEFFMTAGAILFCAGAGGILAGVIIPNDDVALGGVAACGVGLLSALIGVILD